MRAAFFGILLQMWAAPALASPTAAIAARLEEGWRAVARGEPHDASRFAGALGMGPECREVVPLHRDSLPAGADAAADRALARVAAFCAMAAYEVMDLEHAVRWHALALRRDSELSQPLWTLQAHPDAQDRTLRAELEAMERNARQVNFGRLRLTWADGPPPQLIAPPEWRPYSPPWRMLFSADRQLRALTASGQREASVLVPVGTPRVHPGEGGDPSEVAIVSADAGSVLASVSLDADGRGRVDQVVLGVRDEPALPDLDGLIVEDHRTPVLDAAGDLTLWGGLAATAVTVGFGIGNLTCGSLYRGAETASGQSYYRRCGDTTSTGALAAGITAGALLAGWTAIHLVKHAYRN